jgi:hypothetical protein
MVRCCESCVYFVRLSGEPEHERRLIPALATCNAAAGWSTKGARDAALRETNAANRCPHHAPLPAPVHCCANCAGHQGDDRMPRVNGRGMSVEDLRRFTDARPGERPPIVRSVQGDIAMTPLPTTAAGLLDAIERALWPTNGLSAPTRPTR